MSTVLVATPSLKRPFDAMMMTSVCKRQRIEAAPAPQQRQRHRVRFSANDSIHAVDAFDEETKCMLYWSREEMRDIVHREAKLIQVFGSCATYVVDQVVDLIHMAFGLEPMPEKNRDDTDDSDSEDDDKKSSNHNNNNNNTNNDAKLWVANSPARGLEKDLVPELRQRKLRIIRQVLDSQADLHHWRDEVTGECASHELISSALAIHCQNLSEPALKFAQLVATGDAQVVQAEQEAGRLRTSQH